jgi:transcriptional regulator with XRE-family HTH domain
MNDSQGPIRSRLSVRVRTLRLQHGWSISELAERSGVEKSVISRLESGKQRTVHPQNIEKLANAFQISADAITRMAYFADASPTLPVLLEVEPAATVVDNPFVRQISILAEQISETEDEMLRRQLLIMLKQRVDLEVQHSTERLQL